MLLAVALGAFGAHALKGALTPEMKAVYETGVRYQAYHALALFVVAWLSVQWPGRFVSPAGWCFLCGILLFSGSLYALSLTGIKALGAITPVGGLLFMAGWLCVLLAARRA
ncbi:MAG: DUF423 domain-containing protein [Elusimicrobia bacterium]|nr:DUF423 domain-containing protein [Elusimicrobiota bacterium]